MSLTGKGDKLEPRVRRVSHSQAVCTSQGRNCWKEPNIESNKEGFAPDYILSAYEDDVGISKLAWSGDGQRCPLCTDTAVQWTCSVLAPFPWSQSNLLGRCSSMKSFLSLKRTAWLPSVCQARLPGSLLSILNTVYLETRFPTPLLRALGA